MADMLERMKLGNADFAEIDMLEELFSELNMEYSDLDLKKDYK